MTLTDRIRKLGEFDDGLSWSDEDAMSDADVIFRGGEQLENARLAPLITALTEHYKAVENYMGTTNMNAYELVLDKRAELERVVREMEGE